jgi:inosose dehydratase
MESRSIGVQSVVFGERSLSDVLDALGDADVDAMELWEDHLSPHDHGATVAASVAALNATPIDVCGYGVVEFESPDDVEDHVAFADRLGADYLTVNYPPMRDDVTAALLDAAEEYAVDVAIHNYSSIHHDDTAGVFSSLAEVQDVLDRNPHERLGAAVDTGHFLAEDVDPAEAIEAFGDRIVTVHLKDTSAAAIEDVPGAGELELGTVLALLDEHADPTVPLIVEYELDPAEAIDDLEHALANVRSALAE